MGRWHNFKMKVLKGNNWGKWTIRWAIHLNESFYSADWSDSATQCLRLTRSTPDATAWCGFITCKSAVCVCVCVQRRRWVSSPSPGTATWKPAACWSSVCMTTWRRCVAEQQPIREIERVGAEVEAGLLSRTNNQADASLCPLPGRRRDAGRVLLLAATLNQVVFPGL